MTGMAPAAWAPRMPRGESSSTTQCCVAVASGLEKKVRMRFAAFHVLPGHDGIEAVKEPRATQVAFGRCTIGRCGERPRQSKLREVVHEFDRPGLERNARAEQLVQAIGEFAPTPADLLNRIVVSAAKVSWLRQM
jgi:hypothetical protein